MTWSAPTDRTVQAFAAADLRLHGRILARIHPRRRKSGDRRAVASLGRRAS